MFAVAVEPDRSDTQLVLAGARELAACRTWIATHSRSFYLSSLLLPGRVRHAAWALYAFCRRADDAADEGPAEGGRARVDALARRLDAVYAAAPPAAPRAPGSASALAPVPPAALADDIDRAYAAIAARYGIERALPDALLAGMRMDLDDIRYRTFDDLYVYCFRVASVVGLMMTRVMGWSRDDALLRAADLGLAMQLTNIARDVGEDARRGRVYLPDELLLAVGTDRARVLAARVADAPLREAVRLLLARADAHYRAADRGVPLLPRGCRLAIASSRRIYSAIGDDLAAHGHDSITRRAHTSLARKLALVARSLPSLFAAPAPPAPGPADALLGRLLADVGLAPRALPAAATAPA